MAWLQQSGLSLDSLSRRGARLQLTSPQETTGLHVLFGGYMVFRKLKCTSNLVGTCFSGSKSAQYSLCALSRDCLSVGMRWVQDNGALTVISSQHAPTPPLCYAMFVISRTRKCHGLVHYFVCLRSRPGPLVHGRVRAEISFFFIFAGMMKGGSAKPR